MTGRLPRITASEVIRALDGRASKILHPKILHAILKDTALTAERFRELMK